MILMMNSEDWGDIGVWEITSRQELSCAEWPPCNGEAKGGANNSGGMGSCVCIARVTKRRRDST